MHNFNTSYMFRLPKETIIRPCTRSVKKRNYLTHSQWTRLQNYALTDQVNFM